MKRTIPSLSFPLAALCLGAAYGKGAEVIAGLGCLLAIFSLARDGIPPARPMTLWVITVFAGFFLFFAVHDSVMTGDPLTSFLEMRVNLPILLSAILCLHAAREAEWLDAARIGRVVTLATLIICSASVLLFLFLKIYPNSPEFLTEVGGGGRFQFYARNSLMFASQLTGLSFLSLLGHSRRSPLDRHLSELACVSGTLVVLVMAQARGASLTALVMAIIAIWYIRPSIGALWTKLGLAAVSLIVLGFWVATMSGEGSAAISRFTSMLSMTGSAPAADASINERVGMYQAGWQAFLQHPFAGYGYTERFSAAAPYLPPNLNLHYTHLHNDFITHMVAAGLPGLLVFLAYLFLPLAILMLTPKPSRDLKFMALVGTILMAGIASTTAILGHDVHSTYFSMLIVMTLTVALGDETRGRSHAVSRP